jgi:hypothetical protein
MITLCNTLLLSLPDCSEAFTASALYVYVYVRMHTMLQPYSSPHTDAASVLQCLVEHHQGACADGAGKSVKWKPCLTEAPTCAYSCRQHALLALQ